MHLLVLTSPITVSLADGTALEQLGGWVSPSRLIESLQNNPSARDPAPRGWRTQSKSMLLWAIGSSVHPIGASLVVKLLLPSADLFALVFAKCSSLKLDNSVASETSLRKVAFPRPTSGTQYSATIETSAYHAIHWRHARGGVAHFRDSPSYPD